MRQLKTLLPIFSLGMALAVVASEPGSAAGERRSIEIVFSDGHSQAISLDDIQRMEFKPVAVLVFKDGRRQNLAAGDVARIEFNSSWEESSFGRNYFVGKWKVGVTEGGGTFYITLDADGQAHKTLGPANHGTWTVVDGEARISWDDGWHDAIRKVGSKHQKVAYAPGKSFSDPPSNVTNATNTTAQPI